MNEPTTESLWTAEAAWRHSLAVLSFGLLVFLIMAFLMRRNDSTDVLRVCALPLTIIAAIYLIVVGYTETQITPVLALLSAIAGYLLSNIGSGDRDRRRDSSTESPARTDKEQEPKGKVR